MVRLDPFVPLLNHIKMLSCSPYCLVGPCHAPLLTGHSRRDSVHMPGWGWGQGETGNLSSLLSRQVESKLGCEKIFSKDIVFTGAASNASLFPIERLLLPQQV